MAIFYRSSRLRGDLKEVAIKAEEPSSGIWSRLQKFRLTKKGISNWKSLAKNVEEAINVRKVSPLAQHTYLPFLQTCGLPLIQILYSAEASEREFFPNELNQCMQGIHPQDSQILSPFPGRE